MNALRTLPILAILIPLTVAAADLPVSYLVEEKPLRRLSQALHCRSSSTATIRARRWCSRCPSPSKMSPCF